MVNSVLGCSGGSLEGWIVASGGKAEMPADLLDHFRRHDCIGERLPREFPLLVAHSSGSLKLLGLDRLLFGLAHLLDPLGELCLGGRRPLSPDALDQLRQLLGVYTKLV